MKTKILLDENLSYRLIKDLNNFFDEVTHAKELGFESKGDAEIWNYARINGYSIITKDDDYIELAEAYGHPPKIIWLCVGNCSNKEAKDKIINSAPEIKDFVIDPESAIFILS